MTINVLYTINGKYKNLMLASCISMLINNSDKAFNIHKLFPILQNLIMTFVKMF